MSTIEKKIPTDTLKTISVAATPAPVKAITTPVTPVMVEKVAFKTPTKPVAKQSTLIAVKAPLKPTVKTPRKAAAKAPVKTTVKVTEKPAVKIAIKAPAKLLTKSSLAGQKTEKSAKAKKPKLVRDSFTIPKAEYTVLDDLKQRAGKLTRSVKKSELIRAGVKALAAMSDVAFLSALKAVPTIKTGRPSKAKAD